MHLKKIGWRTIKTVIGVFIILLSYHWINRHPAALACLACVFAMQSDVPTSIEYGRYRIVGNILGALLAGVVVQIELILGFNNPYVHIFAVTFGIFLLLIICNQFNLTKSIVNSSATYFVVLLTMAHHEIYLYIFNRVLDCIIGVIIAILVNHLLPGPGN